MSISKARRVWASATAAILVGALVGIFPASGSYAASHDGYCTSGEVCLYEGVEYQGCSDDYYEDIADYSGISFADCGSVALNDKVSSVYNNAVWYDVHVYQHANYGQPTLRIDSSAGLRYLGTMNNAISSHYW